MGLKWDSIIIYGHFLLSTLLNWFVFIPVFTSFTIIRETDSPLQDHPMLLNCFPPSKPFLSPP